MLKVTNLSPDDVEAGAPQVYALNVDAEAFGQGDGAGEAGEGEEVVVVGAEGVGRFEVASVEAEAEEQAKGVGVVVEGGAVVVALDWLHVFRDERSDRHIPRKASRTASVTEIGSPGLNHPTGDIYRNRCR
jgi:hypothetical protein